MWFYHDTVLLHIFYLKTIISITQNEASLFGYFSSLVSAPEKNVSKRFCKSSIMTNGTQIINETKDVLK